MPTPKAEDEIAGKAVDAKGFPAVDPSENVKALSEAANKRQDDLRVLNTDLFNAQLTSMKEIISIRTECAKELVAAQIAESKRIDSLRAYYSERLEVAEAKRIDAIRLVDVNAVGVASQRASDQAAVLASQVTQTAEALRSLVATTANTVSLSQQQLATTLSTRITTLEQAQYKGEGKQAYSDPAFAELLIEVKTLRSGANQGMGVSQGISTSWAVGLATVTILIAIISVGVGIVAISGKNSLPQPTVQYVPAPTAAPSSAPITVPR